MSPTLRNALAIAAISSQESMIGTLVAPFLQDRGHSFTAIGLLIAVFPVLALLSRLPSGLVYRVHRARLLMYLSLAALTLGTALYPVVEGAALVGLLRALTGLAFGAATTINLALYIDSLAPGAPRHRLMAYYAAAQALGYSSGGFTSGLVADAAGYGLAFLVAAAATLLAIPLTSAPSRGDGPEAQTERAAVHGPRSAASSPLPAPHSSATLDTVRDPRIAALVLVGLALNVLFHFGASFFPLYGLAVGLSLTQIGAIRSAYALCNALVRPLTGGFIQRLGHQRVSDWGLVVHGLVLLLVPALTTFWPLVVLFVLAGAARAAVLVANTIAVIEDVDDTRIGRGVASGLLNAGRDLGNVGGPLLGGVLSAALGLATLFLVGPPLVLGLYFALLWTTQRLAPSPSKQPSSLP